MLPEGFILRMQSLLGEEYAAFSASFDRPLCTGLRLNPLKTGFTGDLSRFSLSPVPWCPTGYVYDAASRPGLSSYHAAGLYYLQEPSAMAPAELLDPQPGERVLDLCAAPGGKSTQLAGKLQGRGLLVCNEINAKRAKILAGNIERLGIANALVLNEHPKKLETRFEGYFDKILVDAPCSGEGMFRRQPEARAEWDADAPRRCADRQMEILAQAAKMLRPGGTMVYSTCTFNDTENEGVLKRFLALHPEFSLVPFALPGLPEAKDGYLHLYPHEMRGEGHFVSRLKKTDEADAPVQAAPRRKAPARAAAKGKAPAPIALPDVFSDAFAPERLYTAGDALWMLPEGISIERLSGLRVLRTGLLLAHAEGKRSEPDHALAMALRPEEAARTANLTQTQALAYQAGETLSLGDLPGGYTLLCCEGVSLGWGKQAGGLMKNHYPKGLRRR